MSVPPVLEVKGLTKHFPLRGSFFGGRGGVVKAVDGIDFEIAAGQTFGLVGESGCGKSTLAMLLVKLLEPTSGSIRLDGGEISGIRGNAVRAFRRRVQIVFQDPYTSLDPRQKILGALIEPQLALKVAASRADAVRTAEEAVGMVGLDTEVLKRLPHELSGGQRQRIAIARALALEPRVIIFDEPTSSVDVSVQAQILGLLQELRRSRGLTYLLISHNLVVVRFMSDVVAVMYLGRIVEIAAAADLFASPQHPYSAALISAIPVPDPTRRRLAALAKGDVPSPVNTPAGCRYHPRCPFAERRCYEQEPGLIEVTRGHFAACHFPGRAAVNLPGRGYNDTREPTAAG
jgi:oligopeptide/dipeptide ABC transporter ATP-binding protein